MSIPGLGLAEPEEQPVFTSAEHSLAAGSEWRFEIAIGKHVTIKLLTGSAEVFGTELAISQPYTFTGTKAALYTWHGCTFGISGDAPSSEYTADETPLPQYVNVHFALENVRNRNAQLRHHLPQAQNSNQNPNPHGPRVLLLGPASSGKTSLAKTLTGYAIRSGRTPLVVNLDPTTPMLSLPGTLTAAAFKSIIDIEALDGWGESPISGPTTRVPVKVPLVYYAGPHEPTTPASQLHLKPLLTRLALAVSGRLSSDPDVADAGLIVDTPGSLSLPLPPSKSSSATTTTSSPPPDLIAHIVSEFSISHIFVLGSERLYNSLAKQFHDQPTSSSTLTRHPAAASSSATSPPETISVLKLPKSGGVVDLDAGFLADHRASLIKAYFFGRPRLESWQSAAAAVGGGGGGSGGVDSITSNGITLSPRQQSVSFSELAIYALKSPTSSASTAGGGPDSLEFLPGGIDDDDNGHDNYGAAFAGTGVPQPPSSSDVAKATPSGGRGGGVADALYTRLTTPNPALRNAVLAVVNTDPDSSPAEIRDASVVGFLYVVDVDHSRARLSLLMPVAGRVPDRACVWAEGGEAVLGLV